MIPEPYICIKGPRAGELDCVADAKGGDWLRYCDFEREKLEQLSGWAVVIDNERSNNCDGGYRFDHYTSRDLIGYWRNDFVKDSESNRLLKRAEFLKAVCEKEGVAWLPKEKCLCDAETIWKGDSPGEQIAERVREDENPDFTIKINGESFSYRYLPDKNPNERDYYTKEEIDEKLKQFKDHDLIIADAMLWVSDVMRKCEKSTKWKIVKSHAEFIQRRLGLRK